MRQKNTKKIIVFLTVLCLILSWVLVGRMAVYRPEHVIQAEYLGGYLYGIDNLRQDYVVFRIDLKTGESRRLKVPQTNGTKVCSLSDLTPLKDGNACVVRTETDGRETTLSAWFCDFEKKRLVPGFSLEDSGEEVFFTMTVFEDSIQLLYGLENGDTRQYVLEAGVPKLNQVIPPFGDNAAYHVVTEDGGWYVVDKTGAVYILCDTGDYRMVLDGTRTEGGWRNNFYFSRDAVYFEDSATGETYMISEDDPSCTQVLCEQTYRSPETFDEARFYISDTSGKTVKVGILSSDDGRRLAAVCGEYEYVADKLEWSRQEKIMALAVLWFSLTAAGILFLVLWEYLLKRQKRIPLVLEAAVLTVTLMTAGIWLLRKEILLSVREDSLENDFSTGIQIGYEYIDILDQEDLEAIASGSGDDRIPCYSGTEYRLYRKADGEIFSLNSGRYIRGVPIRYDYARAAYEALNAMERTLETKKAVTLEYTDSLGRQCSAFLPVPVKEGDPVILEVAVSQDSADFAFISRAAGIQHLLSLLSGLLIGMLLFLIWFSLRPVGILKHAALQVMGGKLGAVAPVKGRSEAAVTAVHFNRMSKQLAGQVSGVRKFQEKYEAFVPLNFFEKVHGDMYATMTAGMEQDEGLLQENIREIRSRDGEILSFENGELSCLFAGGPEDALKAAVNILKTKADILKTEGDVPKTEAGIRKAEPRRGISVDFERVFLGVTGNADRSAVSAYSAKGDFNRFLRQKALEYGTPLLITKSAADRIPGFFSGYHVRVLGTFLVRAAAQTETIYEVLDGDTGENMRKKLMTYKNFSQGCLFFEKGQYLHARMEFIRVFSEDKGDLAALRYIRLCDERLSSGETGALPYMEIYG